MKRSELRNIIKEEIRGVLGKSIEDTFKSENTPGHYLVKNLTNKKDYDPMVDSTEWVDFKPGQVKSLHVGRMKQYIDENPSDGTFTWHIITIVKKPGENEYHITKY